MCTALSPDFFERLQKYGRVKMIILVFYIIFCIFIITMQDQPVVEPARLDSFGHPAARFISDDIIAQSCDIVVNKFDVLASAEAVGNDLSRGGLGGQNRHLLAVRVCCIGERRRIIAGCVVYPLKGGAVSKCILFCNTAAVDSDSRHSRTAFKCHPVDLAGAFDFERLQLLAFILDDYTRFRTECQVLRKKECLCVCRGIPQFAD